MKREKRLELLLGYECNNNCRFCYVASERQKFKVKNIQEIKKDMQESRKRGATDLSFLGGEPSIRKDIFELVSYAKEIGFKQIKITTNGRMFSYKNFTKKIIEAGTTKVLFSVHGHTSQLHDYLTRVPGSFNQLMKGIKNVKEYGIPIESNTTIVKQNYKYLPNIAKLMVKLNMISSELIFVFPYGNALDNFEEVVPRYADVIPYVKDAIDLGKKSSTHILIRYVPYCLLQEYENFATELYEPQEREQIGPGVETLDVLEVRKNLDREKCPQCKKCKYFPICEGPWKNYLKIKGCNEFKPILGNKINDFSELIRNEVSK